MRYFWMGLLSLWLGSLAARAQQLTWERPLYFPPAAINAFACAQELSNGDFLVSGVKSNNLYPSVYARVQPGGTVVYQHTGRTLFTIEQDVVPLANDRSLLVASVPGRRANGTGTSRLFFQRLQANGDTLPGISYPLSLLEGVPIRAVREGDSVRVLAKSIGGNALNITRYTLLTVDTTGVVGTVRTYDNTVFSSANPCDLVRTARGGWLLAGCNMGLSANSPYAHPYLVETDAQGRFRRLRNLLLFASGDEIVGYIYNNIVRLRDGSGYVFSGRHTVNNQWWGFLCKVDTALNVVWTYRHPPQATPRVQSTNVYELPDGTLGWLVSDEGTATGYTRTPNLYAVRVSAAGQLVEQRVLSSLACSQLLLYHWRPLAGGGALVVGGYGACSATAVPDAAYVARFDHALPLATAPPAAGRAGSGQLWPNPAREAVTWQGAVPVGVRQAELVVVDLLGREVYRVALAGRGAQATQAILLTGLPAGQYACQLVVDGQLAAPPQKLVVNP